MLNFAIVLALVSGGLAVWLLANGHVIYGAIAVGFAVLSSLEAMKEAIYGVGESIIMSLRGNHDNRATLALAVPQGAVVTES